MSNLICNFAPQKLAKMKDYAKRRLPSTLHKLRKQYKLTQKDLADNLGISVAMYSKIELGERSLPQKHISKLAQYLNTDVAEFRILYLADKLYSEVSNYPREMAGKALNMVFNQYNHQSE